MSSVFLKGASVYLRSLSENDLTPAYREWFNDEEVNRYNSHHRFPNYDEDMRRYYETVIKSRENLVLGIFANESDTHIGNVALERIELLNQSAEFAIIIGDKEYWGRGIGKEAVRLILEHGFSSLHLHRIYCGTAEDNVATQKLALSLGFREEGRSRQAFFKNGAFKDIIHYGLLREEFKKE